MLSLLNAMRFALSFSDGYPSLKFCSTWKGYRLLNCDLQRATSREILANNVQSTHEGQRRPWGFALVRKKAGVILYEAEPGPPLISKEHLSCSIDLLSTRCLDNPSKLPEEAEKGKRVVASSTCSLTSPLYSPLKRISRDVLPRHLGQGWWLRALPKTSLWNLRLLHHLLVWT